MPFGITYDKGKFGLDYKPPVKVFAGCVGEWFDETDAHIIGIEEDPEGRDRLTFDCPYCDHQHTSLRRG